MPIAKQPMSFLTWQPAISPDEVFESSVGFIFLKSDADGNIYWIEQRPNCSLARSFG
ncbi:MAG: hypothetical protein HY843_02780 [Bdellovibrio sp.]|nr:hypothetical protein [Bdellovibrio sp.]